MTIYHIVTRDITRADPRWLFYGAPFDSIESADRTARQLLEFFLGDEVEYRIVECVVAMPEDES